MTAPAPMPQTWLPVAAMRRHPALGALYINSRSYDELLKQTEYRDDRPVVVTPAGDGTYLVVAGVGRVELARHLGMASIPAIVRDLSEEEATQVALEDAFSEPGTRASVTVVEALTMRMRMRDAAERCTFTDVARASGTGLRTVKRAHAAVTFALEVIRGLHDEAVTKGKQTVTSELKDPDLIVWARREDAWPDFTEFYEARRIGKFFKVYSTSLTAAQRATQDATKKAARTPRWAVKRALARADRGRKALEAFEVALRELPAGAKLTELDLNTFKDLGEKASCVRQRVTAHLRAYTRPSGDKPTLSLFEGDTTDDSDDSDR